MSQQSSLLRPFRHATFRNIWVASIASNFGGLIQSVGAGWMMASISNSADMVALVQTSTTLPIMIFALAAGALADSFDRRRIMLSAQVFMLVVSTALAVAAWFNVLSPWLLLTFTFLIGCGTALNNPSWQASVGDMVPREDLAAAVTLNSMGFNITRSLGPAIGGAIVAAAGAAGAFAVNAVSYIAILAALLVWKRPKDDRTLPRESFARAIGAGIRYVGMSPNIGKVMLRGFAFGLSASAILALLPLVARDHVQGGPLTYGLLLGCFGAGAIAGAMTSSRLREKLSSEWIVRLSFAGFFLAALVTALSTSATITGAVLLIAGASWVWALSLFNTTVQLSTPRWVVGRALSIYQATTFGGMAAGSWLWGEIADAQDVSTSLIVAAFAMIAGAALGLRYALPEFKALNLDPLNQFAEPNLPLDLKSRSGPIVVMIDYEIAEQDIPDFLDAMTERRRIRIRDGAGQWALMRDLEKPLIWTETYHVPTWVEYVRHNMRRTKADAENGDRLRALHSGEEPPRVHRMIERQTIIPHDYERFKQQMDMH
ncbi:MFS transporter [Rhizobium sp. SG2393]|uniref:MFS transporter n=1 Tax=Rhizobium sp. SG2393 TaxID=3276279 RepID=UPI00366C5F10